MGVQLDHQHAQAQAEQRGQDSGDDDRAAVVHDALAGPVGDDGRGQCRRQAHQPRFQGCHVQPVLQVQRHQHPDAGHAQEVQSGDQRPVAEAPGAEEVQVHHGAAATGTVVLLPGRPGGHERQARRQQQPRENRRIPLHERQQQSQDGHPEQEGTDRIQIAVRRTAPPGPAGGRHVRFDHHLGLDLQALPRMGRRGGRAADKQRTGQPEQGQDDRDHADGHVDQEGPAPPGLRAEKLDDQPADQRPNGHRHPDDAAQRPVGPAAFAPAEVVLDHPDDLRVEQPGPQPLDEARDVQRQRIRCQAGTHGRQREDDDPGQKDRGPPHDVPGAPRGHQHHAEGQRVAGEHPLDVGVVGVQPGLDGRQHDVDDADPHQ